MEVIWRDVYDRAVDLFGGQHPGTQLEADIVERFEQQPAAIVAAVEKLGERFRAGKVHSPWPLVLRELESAPDRDQIRASDEGDRARALHLAERYIANAGMFMPEPEILAELFGPRGRLERWPELQAHVLECWQARQADAELVEREMLERAKRNAAAYFALRAPRQKLGTDGMSAAEQVETAQQSQTNTALTAVSAESGDIDWGAT